MKKIKCLFKCDYKNGIQREIVHNEVTEGCEWVLAGEGIATIKWDGTACMVRDGKLYKRHDRKKDRKTGLLKDSPLGWEACEEAPDEITGHFPGWFPVGDEPDSKWHREAWNATLTNVDSLPTTNLVDGTYELIGEKINGNPYQAIGHKLIKHGDIRPFTSMETPRDYDGLREFLGMLVHHEGVVWHHPDGRMAKLRRSDFGFDWGAKR